MQFYFILFLIFFSSCTIQTRYNLKQQQANQVSFQDSRKNKGNSNKKNNISAALSTLGGSTTEAATTVTAANVAFTNNSVIASMKSEISQLNIVSEQLTEKINSLEKIIFELKTKNAKKLNTKSKKSTISKAATKQIIKKNKKVKKKVGNFKKAQLSFKNKKWTSAISSYEEYRRLNPRGNNYALATYNIALSLEKLGFREEAKPFYDEILDPSGRYHKTKLAKKIKAKRKKTSSKKVKKI